MSKLKGKVVQAIRFENADVGRLVGHSLGKLRELAGLTQADLAKRLRVGQASVSKIEHRGDVQISSLQKYVGAIGATLRVEVVFSTKSTDDVLLNGTSDRGSKGSKQLVFPIFGDDSFGRVKDVVLSVRPQHSVKIFEGIKTVELRRRFPVAAPGGVTAYIYSTSPVRAMMGSTEIKDVLRLPVADIWRKFGKLAQIGRADFDEYFSGLKEGFVLRIANTRSFSRPINLSELRVRFGFEPPQSFLYASSLLRSALQYEYADLSH